MRFYTIIVVLLALGFSNAQTLEQETCDMSRMQVNIDTTNANAIIGGIFGIRNAGQDGQGCGLVDPEVILSYEAAVWAVRKINNENFIPGIRLGMQAHDTCDSQDLSVSLANNLVPKFSTDSMFCNDTQQIFLGVLGPVSSRKAKPVARMLSSYPVSMISPGASSPMLSDKTAFPYFLRTAQSSSEQIKAMMAAMKALGWERVVVVYTDYDYARDTAMEFVRLSESRDACVVATVALPETRDINQIQVALNNIEKYDVTGAIYIGNTQDMERVMDALDGLPQAAGLQWMISMANSDKGISSRTVRGATYVEPNFVEVTEFYDYFSRINFITPSADNPWLQEWFMNVFQCKLAGINYSPYDILSQCTSKSPQVILAAANTKYAYVDSTIKAVYAFANALRSAQLATCGNQGFCFGLQQMTTQTFHGYLSRVDFDFTDTSITSLRGQRVAFDVNGDYISSEHTFWNYNNQPTGSFSFKNVGSYNENSLNIDAAQLFMYDNSRINILSTLPSSTCPVGGCMNCLTERRPVHISYVPGDLVIAGLFDLHRQGREVLTCGDLKPSHAVNAAAFRYAVQRAKTTFPNILNGVDLGSLMVDLCDNAETGRMFMNNLMGGRQLVVDMHGRVVDPNIVKSTVGELDSTEASAMAIEQGALGMPYLESSATSISLNDREMFPTFSRVIPSDYHQMKAIVLMLKRMEWTYVQVVHSKDAYGMNGYNIFKSEGAKRSICISAVHEYEDAEMVVRNLNNKPEATIVVAIVDTSDYRALLEQVQAQGAQGKFIMVGTEAWGRRQSVASGLEGVARGSIVLDIDAPPMGNFRSWLGQFNPVDMNTLKEMPFFPQWYETSFNCYLDASARGIYTQPCTNTQPITQAPGFTESSYTAFLIRATYVTARAYDMTLREFCGDATGNYNGVCSNFRSDPMVKSRLLHHIQNSNFNIDGYETNLINGEGKANYAFYSYDQTYSRIGTYNTRTEEIDMSTLPISLPVNFQSKCTQTCTECVYLLQTSPYMIIPGPELKIGVNFGLSNQGMNDPFLCTNTKLTNGAQSAFALHYALQLVNKGDAPVSLNNVQVGSLGFDHCGSPARANGLPSALYSGLLEAPHEPEKIPILNSIRAWMTDTTMVTEQMKDFFSALNLPVISPMAAGNMFLDQDEYPTFLRTIQGDNTIASALVTLAKSLAFTHVTFIYSGDSFGQDGMEVFKMIAMQEGVCVVKSMKFDQANAQATVQELIDASSHVVVAYLGLADMDAFLQARGNNESARNLVVLSPEPYPLVYYRRGLAAQNVISLRVKASGMTGYMNWIRSLQMDDIMKQDTLRTYYMELFQCNLPGEYKYPIACTGQNIADSPNFYQDNYVLPIINAVYSFVHAAHETLKATCGDDYSGVCTNFYLDPTTNTQLLAKMQEASFVDPSGARFEFIGREGNIGREIVIFDGSKMEPVADFAGASINFFERSFISKFESTLSSCPPPCIECISNMMDFTYIPGDLLIGGIFDVHNNDITPFSCGEINTLHGFQLLEAFHFAINQVNDKSGMFANIMKNVKLGGVGLDACMSAIRGGYLVSNIHNGLTVLQRDNNVIDPNKIEAYVGTYSSDNSVHLARLLKSLKVPQISFGATSTGLLDQDRYPYFARTVPADNRQAMAMVDYLQKYNIRYVQVVHTANTYGEEGAAEFIRVAKENQICVAQTVSFQDLRTVTAESANEVVLNLLQKPIANTVVVFADTEHVNEMLLAIRRNPGALNKFKFLGSDTWANNPEATEGVEDIAAGSVTMDLDVNDLRVFDDYLEFKSPTNYPENPWFPEYYEKIQNCYLTTPKSQYPSKCSANSVPVVKSSRYKQDTVIIHVINAVYSAAIGIDKALKQECGVNYTTVCEAYRNRDNRRDLVLEKILEAEFTDASNQEFSFADSRDGNKGYVLYSFDQSDVLGYVYNPIARYSSNNMLTANDIYKPSWDGSCDRVDSCTECPTVRNPLTRYMLTDNNNPINNKPATIILTMPVHERGNDEYRCGAMNMNTFLRGLSFVYTIQNLLPARKFDLRTLFLDNCNNALRVDQDLFNMLAKGSLCNTAFNNTDGSMIDASTVVGVHTTSSRFVVAANRITNPRMIQLTSSSASSNALSQTFAFPYFARMVPPDNVQMETIAKILQANGWTYVGVLYSLESYGINGYRNFRDTANDKQLSCVGFAEGIRQFSTQNDIRAVLRRLADENGIGVIVIISVEPRAILQALVDEGLASRYLVIGTDTWATMETVTEGLWEHFRGAITISFRDSYFENFLIWLSQISYTNRKGIPDSWFEEFYQHIHRCRLTGSTVMQEEYTDVCTQTMIIRSERLRDFDFGIRDIAAAFAIGSGLNEFEKRLCRDQESFTDCMARVQDSREKLFQRTLAVDWQLGRLEVTPPDDYRLLIGDKRYWDIGYNINTLKDGNVYEKIGKSSDTFVFDDDLYDSYKSNLVSKCPSDKACDCAFDDVAPLPLVAKYQSPIEPRNYLMYDEDTGSQTYTWPIWAIAVAVLTCIGLLVGLILFFYFLIAYPVRGGTTALGFMMMIGVFGIYAINFAFFLPASAATCGAREAVLGIVYAIVFAALFVKAVDNWRFKDSEYSTDRYVGFSNPCTLITIAFGIVLVQCIIPAEWLILRNPSASMMDDATDKHDWMWCDPHDFYDTSLVLSMVFVVFLVILTAIFAALAWDSESNYYESKWIFVSCVCTCGCFLVWMVVITNAGAPNRDPAIAIANFINATALLIFIPMRKLILLIQFQSDDEKLKSIPMDDANTDVYSTVYTNQMYQPDVFQSEYKSPSENGFS